MTDLATAKHLLDRRKTPYNTGLAKVAVQCSADSLVVNQSWFSASTFVVKIATFAKPETVSTHPKRPTPQTSNKH